jgi:hypothetical protein
MIKLKQIDHLHACWIIPVHFSHPENHIIPMVCHSWGINKKVKKTSVWIYLSFIDCQLSVYTYIFWMVITGHVSLMCFRMMRYHVQYALYVFTSAKPSLHTWWIWSNIAVLLILSYPFLDGGGGIVVGNWNNFFFKLCLSEIIVNGLLPYLAFTCAVFLGTPFPTLYPRILFLIGDYLNLRLGKLLIRNPGSFDCEHLILISFSLWILVPDYVKPGSWCHLSRAHNWFGETPGGREIGMGRKWGGNGEGEASSRATWDQGGRDRTTQEEGFQVSKRDSKGITRGIG